MRNRLPRAVYVLGVVSLLMDVASEMLYPIGPIFLVSLGASVAWIGVIEGVAEAIAGLSKGYFGGLSDSAGRRRPFVTLGYALSAVSKPIPAIAASVGGVLGSRMLDRIGKGVRTAPRDALLAGYVTEDQRGAAFGLHRAMDTVGAAIGPIIALAWLALHPGGYRTLFLLAFIPSALAAVATLVIRESRFVPVSHRPGIATSLAFWREAPAEFRRVVALLTLFAIVNASDVFLILRARELGFNDTAAIGGYIGYNFVFAAAAYPAGILSDRFGRRAVTLAGLALYVVVYLGFAFAGRIEIVWGLFALYGVYAAMTEGVAKAWLSDLLPNERRGLGLGLHATLASLGALVASSWTGALWDVTGASVPLAITACVAAIAAVGLASKARP
jgi:MFS family permease